MNYGILRSKAGGYVFTEFAVFFAGTGKKIGKSGGTCFLTNFIFFFVGKFGNGNAGHPVRSSRARDKFAVAFPARFRAASHQRYEQENVSEGGQRRGRQSCRHALLTEKGRGLYHRQLAHDGSGRRQGRDQRENQPRHGRNVG